MTPHVAAKKTHHLAPMVARSSPQRERSWGMWWTQRWVCTSAVRYVYDYIVHKLYMYIYMYIHINLQVQMHMLVRSNSKTYWTVTFQHIVWGLRICAYKYFPIKWISLSENHLFTIISPGNNLAKGGYWTSIALGDFNKIQQGFTKQS